MKSNAAWETPSGRERERALRFGAERICFWCLCGSAACRRARACRGDVGACAGLVVSWLAAIEAERRVRPDFAAIERQIETPEALHVYRAWRRALGRLSLRWT